MCASSTIAATSSGVYCCAPTRVPLENTPPVPQYLITSAPYFTFLRTIVRTATGPSATPSARSPYSGAIMFSSQCPPVMPSAGPDARMRGPITSPALIASRSAMSV